MDQQTKAVDNPDALNFVGSDNGENLGSIAFNRKLNKWATAVAMSGRMKFLGYFETEDAATNRVAEAQRTWMLTLRIRRHE
jgi:hypothetical protein